MRDNLTPYDIANTIRMKREDFDGAVIIVEGTTDVRLYKKFIDEDKCSLEPAYQKDNVIEAISILKNEEGILGIVDADYWNVEKDVSIEDNIFLTDTHDLETMILCSPALENCLSEYANEKKLNKFLQAIEKNDIREILLESTLYIGYVKWTALKKEMYLKFKGLKLENFINPMLSLNKSEFLTQLLDNSNNFHNDIQKIKKETKKLQDDKHDPWQICCGHHLSTILLIGLKKIFGIYTVNSLKSNRHLEGCLRMCYESSYFEKTNLYQNLKRWEIENSEFVILDHEKFDNIDENDEEKAS